MNDTPNNTGPFPNRRSIRLTGYDYSQAGLYSVTICTQNRKQIFGSISQNDELLLTDLGNIVERQWLALGQDRAELALDAYVVMPNHFHGIIGILPTLCSAPGTPLADYIRDFKSLCAREARTMIVPSSSRVWQRGYYEHIIRSERSLESIRTYIETNPANWRRDPENMTGS